MSPRAKKEASKKIETTFELKGFIKAQMTLKQRELYAKHTWSEPFESLLTAALDDGLKFGVGWDEYHSAYVASFTQKNPEHEMVGWVLTAFGPTWEKAADVLFYKHFVMLDKNWKGGWENMPDSDFG